MTQYTCTSSAYHLIFSHSISFHYLNPSHLDSDKNAINHAALDEIHSFNFHICISLTSNISKAHA